MAGDSALHEEYGRTIQGLRGGAEGVRVGVMGVNYTGEGPPHMPSCGQTENV